MRRDRLRARRPGRPGSAPGRCRRRPATARPPARAQPATHSLTSVVLPKPAGAEMRVSLRRSPSSSLSVRRGRLTTVARGGGICSFIAKTGMGIVHYSAVPARTPGPAVRRRPAGWPGTQFPASHGYVELISGMARIWVCPSSARAVHCSHCAHRSSGTTSRTFRCPTPAPQRGSCPTPHRRRSRTTGRWASSRATSWHAPRSTSSGRRSSSSWSRSQRGSHGSESMVRSCSPDSCLVGPPDGRPSQRHALVLSRPGRRESPVRS